MFDEFTDFTSAFAYQRKDAYVWLSDRMMLPAGMTHIGELGEYYCNEVIRESENYLRNNLENYRMGA